MLAILFISNQQSAEYKMLMIKRLSTDYGFAVRSLCRYYNISKSRYYYNLNKKKTELEVEQDKYKLDILEIGKIHDEYGYRRMAIELRAKYLDICITDKIVNRLCRELGWKSTIRKKPKYFTSTKSEISDNVLNQNFKSDEPNKKWVMDITELALADKKYYYTMVLDLFNLEVVSFNLSDHSRTELVLDCLKDAVKKRGKINSAIFHTDRGKQFTSNEFKTYLKDNDFIPSNSRAGNCLDNSLAENHFSHFKAEFFYKNQIDNEKQLRKGVKKYVEHYNNKRRQLKTEKTPVELREEYYRKQAS